MHFANIWKLAANLLTDPIIIIIDSDLKRLEIYALP